MGTDEQKKDSTQNNNISYYIWNSLKYYKKIKKEIQNFKSKLTSWKNLLIKYERINKEIWIKLKIKIILFYK